MKFCYAFRRGTFYPFIAGQGWNIPAGETRAKYLGRVKNIGFDGIELGFESFGGFDAAEQEANAQLSERVRAIREKQDTTLGAMERKYGAAVRAQEAVFKEVAALKQANAALVAANRKLIDEGVAFSDDALMAELQSLRAARDGESAEREQIIAGLDPIIEAANREEETDA